MPQLAPEIPEPEAATRHRLASMLSEMVAHPEYPCLGARSVFHRDRATVRVYDELAGEGVAEQLLADLRTFAAETDPEQGFASFVATFRGPAVLDERHFERLLWSQLEQIHSVDDATWNTAVSADPSDQHFAFSAGGTAYFIVGLHPRASRDARRTPTPRWCSTSTSSLRRCARRASSRGCATRSVSATTTCREASTPWWPTTARPPRRGSTPAARWVPRGRRRSPRTIRSARESRLRRRPVRGSSSPPGRR